MAQKFSDDELVAEGLERHLPVGGERAQSEAGAALAFLELGHAGLLESVEVGVVIAVMAAVLAGPPRGQCPEHERQGRHGQPHPDCDSIDGFAECWTHNLAALATP